MILGIDEVGRGPWAGPLVVGAVVLGGAEIDGLTDSKKLTKRRREALEPIILQQAAAVGLGWVTATELDEIGMSAALRLATKRAVKQIHVPFHEIIIDGTVNFLVGTPLEQYVKTMPKADLLIPSVSAASIIAKVARDRYMAEQGKLYPVYKFTQNAGYGVAAHRAAIEKYGVTPLHRLSFAPLRAYDGSLLRAIDDGVDATEQTELQETTCHIGNLSETEAANELLRRGHEIVARNWKTKYCEIDIISKKDDTIYFTEVKHRRTGAWGDGFDAITPKKLNQMKFAARLYAHQQHMQYDLQLSAISTCGDPPVFERYLEIH